ncbi:Hpt domain protein [Pseudodesulfovibrio aespoeensis Aspo-2]|uniref:Hpt domain protein n=2 Tax=Desulfovibrionaceae TaxID=194924 RepID=E6VZW9_PSEA9|nr:Hpt domain protein [Pseudodesulfovibrio aespoeensis Aspo-2]
MTSSGDGMKRFTVVVEPELAAIMPRYFELQRAELAVIGQAVAQGDADVPRMFGHRLKGTGASYGFPRLTELGAAIERAALGGDLEGAARLADEVGRFLDNVRVTYGGQGAGETPGGETP